MRQTYLAKRQSLHSDLVCTFNQQICQSLIGFITWDRIKVMHVYLPIITRNEVDTYPVIDYMRTTHADIQIVVPKVAPWERISQSLFSYANYPITGQ